jgi:hypothetical protein
LSPFPSSELHLLLDAAGALVAYQEEGTSWAGVLGFSSEARARQFVAASQLEAAEIATIDPADAEQVASLINAAKRSAMRYLLLDLDWQSGECKQVQFNGSAFGEVSERRFTPRKHHR